jgi:hypothetical protein
MIVETEMKRPIIITTYIFLSPKIIKPRNSIIKEAYWIQNPKENTSPAPFENQAQIHV